MSFEFVVTADDAPDIGGLVARVSAEHSAIARSSSDDLVTEADPIRAYIEGRSVRGVECFWRPREFVVRMLAMSSTEDYELALQIIEAASAEIGAPIKSEYGEHAVSGEQLRKTFNADWIQDMQCSSVRVLDHISKRDGGKIITVPALFRACHYGPRRLSELRAASSDNEFAARVVEEVRRIQYMDAGEYHEAVAYHGDGENGAKFTYTPWLPSVKYWFPKIDYFFVGDREEDTPYLPASVLKALPSSKIRWLDEVQVLVETFTQSEWADLINATRKSRCEPHAEFKRRKARAERKRK